MLVDVRRYRSLSRRDRTLQDSCDVEELENCPSTPPLAVFLSSEDITSTIFPLRHATSEPASSRSRAPFNSSPLSVRNSPAVGCKSVRVRGSKRTKDRRPFSECFGTALAEKLTGTLGTLKLTRARAAGRPTLASLLICYQFCGLMTKTGLRLASVLVLVSILLVVLLSLIHI